MEGGRAVIKAEVSYSFIQNRNKIKMPFKSCKPTF
jgi:hypothetical protein